MDESTTEELPPMTTAQATYTFRTRLLVDDVQASSGLASIPAHSQQAARRRMPYHELQPWHTCPQPITGSIR